MAKILDKEIPDEKIRYLRIAIQHNDEELLQAFFNRKLSEEEKEEVLENIFVIEENMREERIMNELRVKFKNLIENGFLYIEKNIDKLNKEQIDFILSNFNEPVLEGILPSSPEEKQALREKLLFKNLSFNDNVENIQKLMESNTSKSNLYHFIAEHIAKNYFKQLVYDEFEDVFYTFTEYGWVELTELDIKKAIKQILQSYYSIKSSNEIFANLKVMVPEASFLSPPLFLIPLQNGVYSIEKNKLLPYTPNLFFKQKSILPIYYNPGASCPEIEKFLIEISDNEEMTKLLYEIIAYTLYRDNPLQKAFFLIGSGANGKSTYISLINAFLGQKNVAAIPFQTLETNRFTIANLYEKYANLFADLPKHSLSSISFFKALTGGDVLSAEKKFQQRPIEFKNFAKLIFSANEFPRVYEDNDAFFRRLIIVQFNKTFLGDKADVNKLQKITTQEELSGLFNTCVNILPDILERGFSYTKSLSETKKEYIMKSNSIAYFIEEMLESSETSHIDADELYAAYVDFCTKKQLAPSSLQYFGRYFQKECVEAGIQVSKKRKSRGMVFIGVKLKEQTDFQSVLYQDEEKNVDLM